MRPDDGRGFSQAIIALVGDATRRHVLATDARQTAERRDVQREDQELLRQYGALMGEAADPRPASPAVSLETQGALTRC